MGAAPLVYDTPSGKKTKKIKKTMDFLFKKW
jgi:hypothetical protein